MKKIVISFVLLFIAAYPARSEEYDAEVTTKKGTFSVPVEVENGEVTTVYWNDEDHMPLYGGELFNRKAWAVDSAGKNVDVLVKGYEEPDTEEYYAGYDHYTWDLKKAAGDSDSDIVVEEEGKTEEDDYIYIRM